MNDPDLANIGTWTLPLRLIVILSACLLLIGIAYLSLLQTQQQQLTRAQHNLDQLRATFAQQHAKIAPLADQQASYTALRQALDQQVQPDAAPNNTADLLVATSQIGLGTQVNFVTFQPQPSIKHDLYTETPIKLSVTGNYHNLATFISNLAQHPGIITLHDIVLQRTAPPDQKKQPLNLTFTLKAYLPDDWQPPQSAPSTKLPAPPSLPATIQPSRYTEAGRRDPFARLRNKPATTPGIPLHSQGPLQKYALDTLQMVGTVSQQQQHRGLLQSPDGLIHQVKVGSYVGQNQGRVQTIHPDKIIVHEHRGTNEIVHHITLRPDASPNTRTQPAL
jgi:type IV pilus assembly protein PilO